MDYYYDAVLKAAKYIEDHLTMDIKVKDIIEKIGFSQFHFMRIFKSISGHTISQYIKRRKITEAAMVLLNSNMRIIDIAILYGYNSQEAFTRAFKEVYNITPNTYRMNKRPYKNIEQIILDEDLLHSKKGPITTVEPRIIYKDAFYIAGLQYMGKNDNFDIPKLWNRFSHKVESLKSRIDDHICYGYESTNEDFDTTGCFKYIAGVAVSGEINVPKEMTLQKIPSNKYAIFPLTAVVENVPQNIGEIYAIHLPNSGVKAIGSYDFEYYDVNFNPNSENAYISLYIPIE